MKNVLSFSMYPF